MAVYPCTNCGQRFMGAAENVYLQHFSGDQVESYRVLICGPCCDDMLQLYRERALFRDSDGEWNFAEGNVEPKWQSAPRGRLSGRQTGQRAP